MSTINPISKNPFIIVDSKEVHISFPKKEYQFSISDIQKIYVAKKRPGYFASFFGRLLSVRDTNYYLCVIGAEKGVKIPINRLQRYYCVKLIALLRQPKNNVPDFV